MKPRNRHHRAILVMRRKNAPISPGRRVAGSDRTAEGDPSIKTSPPA